MDGQIMSYMPFAQPSFVRSVFATSPRIRRNGHLFRCFIKQHRPSLRKYPLVKGCTSFPYTLPTVPTWLWIKAKAKIGRQFVDPTPSDFLFSISEFVLDTVHSSKVRSYAPYDHRTIVTMVEQFYSGRSELVREVDWWLAFEIWRQGLESS